MSSVLTQICTVNETINFNNVAYLTKLESKKYQVPEINGKWWIEATPYGGKSSFSASSKAPAVKIVIEVSDEALIKSKLLFVTVNMKNIGSVVGHYQTYNSYFSSYVQIVGKSRMEISTESTYYKNSASSTNTYSAYLYPWNYSYNNSFFFECSIRFQHRGEYDGISHKVKNLLSAGNVLSLQTFASLLDDDTFADFTFTVRGQQFKVHKCLLGAASEVFKAMFSCGLDETKDNSATVDCDPEVFKHFIEFIYTNKIDLKVMPSICIELHELAHRYGIDLLVKVCMVFIEGKKIDAGSALQLYEFAATFGVEKLLETSWEFIKTQMLNIQESCEPKPIDEVKVKAMLDKKKKHEDDLMEKKRKFEQETLSKSKMFEQEMKSFIAGKSRKNTASTTKSSQPAKKRNTRK